MSFALFWLGEYANVTADVRAERDPVLRRLAAARWTARRSTGSRAGSGSSPRSCFFFFVFSWVKATVPRYRYDQLMRLGWKVFLAACRWSMVVCADGAVGILRTSVSNGAP